MLRFLPLLLLPACSAFPELDARMSPGVSAAPFLDFLTVDEMAALGVETAPHGEALDPASEVMAARLAGLRARAAILRGPIFSGDDRARLSGAPG
ncbi:MAG: hypothetical protein AAFR53_15755 [Pseudomonadota bacterium]